MVWFGGTDKDWLGAECFIPGGPGGRDRDGPLRPQRLGEAGDGHRHIMGTRPWSDECHHCQADERHQDRLKCPDHCHIRISPAHGLGQARLCSLMPEPVLLVMVWSGWRGDISDGWRESCDESQAWRQHLDTDNGTLCSCK